MGDVMATKGFTKIDNSIIFDSELSLEALGLYIKLQHLASIPNFSIKRDYIKSISGYGETAFRRVWKELKDKGVLTEVKTRSKGKYEYTYTLTGQADNKKAAIPEEQKKHKQKHIDSDGNAPIKGQVSLDDVLAEQQESESLEKEDIASVAEVTGFTNEESEELLKAANNDVHKVIEGHKYALSQSSVKNIFKYTRWAIKNNMTPREVKPVINSIFNSFQQRTYDFDKLEKALLYGEPYDLPA